MSCRRCAPGGPGRGRDGARLTVTARRSGGQTLSSASPRARQGIPGRRSQGRQRTPAPTPPPGKPNKHRPSARPKTRPRPTCARDPAPRGGVASRGRWSRRRQRGPAPAPPCARRCEQAPASLAKSHGTLMTRTRNPVHTRWRGWSVVTGQQRCGPAPAPCAGQGARRPAPARASGSPALRTPRHPMTCDPGHACLRQRAPVPAAPPCAVGRWFGGCRAGAMWACTRAVPASEPCTCAEPCGHDPRPRPALVPAACVRGPVLCLLPAPCPATNRTGK